MALFSIFTNNCPKKTDVCMKNRKKRPPQSREQLINPGMPKEPIDGTWMGDYVSATFNNTIEKQPIFWQWFLDQRFFGLKYHLWERKNSLT